MKKILMILTLFLVLFAMIGSPVVMADNANDIYVGQSKGDVVISSYLTTYSSITNTSWFIIKSPVRNVSAMVTVSSVDGMNMSLMKVTNFVSNGTALFTFNPNGSKTNWLQVKTYLIGAGVSSGTIKTQATAMIQSGYGQTTLPSRIYMRAGSLYILKVKNVPTSVATNSMSINFTYLPWNP